MVERRKDLAIHFVTDSRKKVIIWILCDNKSEYGSLITAKWHYKLLQNRVSSGIYPIISKEAVAKLNLSSISDF